MTPIPSVPRRAAARLTLALAFTLGAVPAHAADPGELYARGKAAFERREPDYVTALQYLAAYREAASAVLGGDPGFRRLLDQAIDHAAAQLDLALRTKRELDKHGEVREVTIETEGKLDRPGAPKVQVRVRLPDRPVPPKPALTARPPREATTAVVTGIADVATKTRPVEPARPVAPQPAAGDCSRQLQACQEKQEKAQDLLARCEGRLEAGAKDPDPELARTLAACRERLAASTGTCREIEDRYNRLAARYLELEERCGGG